MQASRFKAVARGAGYAVLALSIVFLVRRLSAVAGDVQSSLSWELAGLIALAALAYTAGLHGLSVAWHKLLLRLERSPGSLAAWHAVYARTSIARYLPGNVFHFAGRHLLGRKLGASDRALAIAAVQEIAGLSAAALLVAGVFAWLLPEAITVAGRALPAGVLVAGALLGALAIVAGERRLPQLLARVGAIAEAPALRTRDFVPCLVGYLGFSLAGAGGAFALAGYFEDGALALAVIPAYAAAWLVGFVVPGAGGGLGVREAAFVLLTDQALGSAPALGVALAMRAVTTLGDLLFFLLSFARRVPVAGGADSALADVQDEGR